MNVKFHKITSYTWNFQNFSCVTILVKFDIHFLGLPWEIFFGVTTDDVLHPLALEKCKNECNIVWIILIQGFGPLKIKITQFPCGFLLKVSLKIVSLKA